MLTANKKPKNNIVFTERSCSKCEVTKPNHSGSYEVFNGGKNQRWVCFDCVQLKGVKNG